MTTSAAAFEKMASPGKKQWWKVNHKIFELSEAVQESFMSQYFLLV